MTITLAAAQPITGQAGSNSAIDYEICLDDISTTDAFQTISGTLTTSPVALHTPLTAHSSIIKTVHLKNTTAAPVTVNISLAGKAHWQGLLPAFGGASYDGSWHVYDSSGFPQTAGATGPTGPRGLTWQGAWNSGTTYAVDDAVYYATTGQSYRSLVAGNLNHTPPASNDGFWFQLVSKGDTGSTGSTGPPGVIQTVTAGTGLSGGGSAAAVTVSMPNTGPGVTGPIGAATIVPIVTIDAQGRITALTQTTIAGVTPAGAASGDLSGTYPAPAVAKIQGTAVTTTPPTNGQVLQYVAASTAYIPFSYAGDVAGGPSAAIVQGIRGITVANIVPLPGQDLEYVVGVGWVPADEIYNIISYGADPGNATDSTVAIYNAINACSTIRTAAAQATVSTQQTVSGSFSLTVAANSLPASGSINIQTTLGGITVTYTGGGTTTLACTLAANFGVSGGLVLAGSIVGTPNPNAQGGTVFCPAGLYKVTQQIVVSWHGVALLGPSASSNNDASGIAFYLLGGAFFNYNGGIGSTVIIASPIPGTARGQLQGFSVRNLNISCQGVTGYGLANGLLLLSCTGFALENIYIYDPLAYAYGFDVLKDGTLQTATAHDCTRGTIKNLKFRCLEQPSGPPVATLTNPAAVTNLNALAGSTVTLSAAPTSWPNTGNDMALFEAVDQLVGVVCEYLVKYTGISGSTLTGCTTMGLFPNESNSGAGPGYLPNALMFAGSKIRHAEGGNATGIRMHGSATANTCCSVYQQLTGTYYNGNGISFLNCDSNIILNPMLNRGGAGGTGIGVDLHGSTIGAIGTCRNNVLYSGSAGAGGVRGRGTGAADFGYTFPSQDNYWHDYEVANGEPTPSIGLGATLYFSVNGSVNAVPQFSTKTGDRLLTGRMTTTQVITGTALADITGLSFPIIQPGVQYEFEALVMAVGSATSASTGGGIGVGVNLPAGATLQCAVIGQQNATQSKTTFLTGVNTIAGQFGITTALTVPVLLKGMIFAGTASSHTGTVQVRLAASGSASTVAATATVQPGSFLKAVKVG